MMSRSRVRRSGYTLIELMITVGIIGILSALAIPAFNNYVMRSRAVEATEFLGEVRLAEESYRSEFGRYCDLPDWNPATYAPPGEYVDFDPTIGSWRQLGAFPDASVRFQYQVLTGAPNVATGVAGFPSNDFWFITHARADLDGDGTEMWLEGYSTASHYFISRGDPSGGVYLSEGWE